jgi:hypothetical protein
MRRSPYNRQGRFPLRTLRGQLVCPFLKKSCGGLTWGDSTVLDSVDFMGNPPSIIYSQGRLHAIWGMNIDGDSMGIEVFYRSSDDFGLTWSPRIFLSTPERIPHIVDSQFPEAYADPFGHIIVTWFDYKYGSMCGTTGDILGRISTDNGTSWLEESRLTFTQSGGASSPVFLNNTFFAVWSDYWLNGCGYAKIEYATSVDTGQSWTSPEVITGNEVFGENDPFLFHYIHGNDTIFNCLFDRGNTYFTRDKPFPTGIEPSQNSNLIDLQITVYPNAFNSSTMITFENPKGDNGEIEIFDINGRIIWKKSISGKEGRIIWDATNEGGTKICSGIYFVRFRTTWAEKTVKVVFIK